MLSFNRLGSFGRLGNQMFQYASLRGIAAHHGYEVAIPFSPELDAWQDHELHKYFKMGSVEHVGQVPNQLELNERFFDFDRELFDHCPDGSDLMGYYQSYKYFEAIRPLILSDFTFKHDYELPEPERYIAIHVRRGDYVRQPQFHPTCSPEYYRNALKVINEELPVVVMSDDIEWCRANIPGDIFVEGTTNAHDLYIQTHATHNIIANSSFSWWGAWLNRHPAKIVVAPKVWFGPAYSHDTKDLLPTDWHRI